MVSHNNVIPNAHFHKHWARLVRTWFNQPGRKHRRRDARTHKLASLGSKPLAQLRPIARCQTQRYNGRVRVGRGFSLQELAGVKITPEYARQIGIAVDVRRVNRSEESLNANVQRLREYISKVHVVKKGEKAPVVKQFTGKVIMPFKSYGPVVVEERKVTEEDRKGSVFHTIRMARASARLVGKKVAKKEGAKEAAAN